MTNRELQADLVKYVQSSIPLVFLHGFNFQEVDMVTNDIQSQNIIDEKYRFNITQGFSTRDSIRNSDYEELLDSLIAKLKSAKKQIIVVEGAESLFNSQQTPLSEKLIDILVKFVHKVQSNKYYQTTIIFNGSHYDIPPSIRDGAMIIEKSLPDTQSIKRIIHEFLKFNKINKMIDENEIEIRLIDNLKGFSHYEVTQALSFIYYEYGIEVFKDGYNSNVAREIYTLKEQMLKKSGTLSIVETDESIQNIIGLKRLTDYIESERKAFQELSLMSKNNIDLPKGILILGEPGTGKSMTAKATANALGLKLIKFDISKIMGKYVGDSEKNIINTLKIIEHMSPCVLWIDEIEKAFSGVNDNDNQVLRRVFGILLSWMSDDNKGAFVVGTANNIAGVLPPEFLRKGRFDEIFYVNKPDNDARFELFNTKLRERNVILANNNRERTRDLFRNVISDSEGFTGAEIEYICNRVAREYHMSDYRLRTGDIILKIKKETEQIKANKNTEFSETDYGKITSHYNSLHNQELSYIQHTYTEDSIEDKVSKVLEDKINSLIDQDIEKILNKKLNQRKYQNADYDK